MRQDLALVQVSGSKIFTEAAAAMCREIVCSGRLPFLWLCSENVIPCSFTIQGGFPVWIAIAYGNAQYSSCQNAQDLPSGNREVCAHAFFFSRVRSEMSHTATVGNCLLPAGRKHWLQTSCLRRSGDEWSNKLLFRSSVYTGAPFVPSILV